MVIKKHETINTRRLDPLAIQISTDSSNPILLRCIENDQNRDLYKKIIQAGLLKSQSSKPGTGIDYLDYKITRDEAKRLWMEGLHHLMFESKHPVLTQFSALGLDNDIYITVLLAFESEKFKSEPLQADFKKLFKNKLQPKQIDVLSVREYKKRIRILLNRLIRTTKRKQVPIIKRRMVKRAAISAQMRDETINEWLEDICGIFGIIRKEIFNPIDQPTPPIIIDSMVCEYPFDDPSKTMDELQGMAYFMKGKAQNKNELLRAASAMCNTLLLDYRSFGQDILPYLEDPEIYNLSDATIRPLLSQGRSIIKNYILEISCDKLIKTLACHRSFKCLPRCSQK